MKRCDICLKKCEELTQLSEHYKTDDIEECCVDCMNIMNKQLHKINKNKFFEILFFELRSTINTLKLKITDITINQPKFDA